MLDVGAIRNATALLRFVTRVGPEAWDGAPEEDVVQGLQAVAEAARVMDALKISAAGAVERRSDKYTRAEALCSRLGYGGTRGLVADVFGTGYYQAKAWLELAADTHTPAGSSVPRRPALAEALRRGELSVDTAKTIRDALAEVTTESIPGGTLAAEATLVANATAGRVNPFARNPHAGPRPEEPDDPQGDARRPQRSDVTAEEPGEAGAGPSSGARGAEPACGDAPRGQGATPGQGTGLGYWPVVPPRSLEALGEATGAASGVGVGARGGWRGAPRHGGVFQGSGTPVAGGRPSLKNVKQQARGWGLVLEPRKAELSHAAQHRARSLTLTPAEGGGFKIAGYAPEVEGQAIITVLDAYLSPRTADPLEAGLPVAHEDRAGSDRVRPTGAGVGAGARISAAGGAGDGREPGVVRGASADGRSRAQKSFDALAQVFRSHAASEDAPRPAGGAPTLLITATLQALDAHLAGCSRHEGGESGRPGASHGGGETARGAASDCGESPAQGWWPRSVADLPLDANGVPDAEALIDLRFARIGQEGLPVPFSAVAHLLCDASIQVMLQDPGGMPLKLGRTRRIFSTEQRKVLGARDRHCRAPGCDIPARWCEVHHVVPWHRGGKTDVDNGILLCSFHHHEIDRGRLKVDDAPGEGRAFRERHTVRMPRVGVAQESLLPSLSAGAA